MYLNVKLSDSESIMTRWSVKIKPLAVNSRLFVSFLLDPTRFQLDERNNDSDGIKSRITLRFDRPSDIQHLKNY